MCAEPRCGNITTLLLTQRTDRASFVSAYDAFAVPMLDFCYYMRVPGTPCPPDKLQDFLSHEEIREKDAICALSTNYSFVRADKFPSVVSNLTCPTDCLVFAQRVKWLLDYMPCSLQSSNQPVLNWLYGVRTVCYLDNLKVISTSYEFTPGWPLPSVPPEETAQPITLAPSGPDSSASSSTETTAPPTVGSVEGGEPEPHQADDTTPRSPKPTTTIATKTSNGQTSGSDEPQDPLRAATTTTARGGTLSTTEPREQQTSRPRQDEATLPPPGQASTGQASSQYYAPYSVGAAVCILLVAAIFVYRRRKRSLVKDSNSDRSGLYSTLDSPSTEGRTHDLRMKGRCALTIQKEIATKHIQDIRIIGSGGFGVAYLVRDTLNDRLLVSKRLVPNQITDEKIDLFFHEIQLVSTIQHPCIVTFIGATWTNRTDVQALFEFMDGGDLRTYLDVTPMTGKWTREKLTIAIDVANALVYVHSELSTPLVHRDLKSRNILLTKSPLRAKVSDFGVAREVTENGSMTNGVGTSRWLAPEVILGKGQGSDNIYCLLIVFDNGKSIDD